MGAVSNVASRSGFELPRPHRRRILRASLPLAHSVPGFRPFMSIYPFKDCHKLKYPFLSLAEFREVPLPFTLSFKASDGHPVEAYSPDKRHFANVFTQFLHTVE